MQASFSGSPPAQIKLFLCKWKYWLSLVSRSLVSHSSESMIGTSACFNFAWYDPSDPNAFCPQPDTQHLQNQFKCKFQNKNQQLFYLRPTKFESSGGTQAAAMCGLRLRATGLLRVRIAKSDLRFFLLNSGWTLTSQTLKSWWWWGSLLPPASHSPRRTLILSKLDLLTPNFHVRLIIQSFHVPLTNKLSWSYVPRLARGGCQVKHLRLERRCSRHLKQPHSTDNGQKVPAIFLSLRNVQSFFFITCPGCRATSGNVMFGLIPQVGGGLLCGGKQQNTWSCWGHSPSGVTILLVNWGHWSAWMQLQFSLSAAVSEAGPFCWFALKIYIKHSLKYEN